MKKHKNFLDDLPLKLVSVLVAVIIWYVVVTVNDPITKVSFQVPVQVTNESYIASGKKTYQIDADYQNVWVTITGNQSVLNKMTEDDVSVVADMTQIVNMDTNPVYVPIKATCKNKSNVQISTDMLTIPIEIEDVDSAKFPVTIDTGNTKPAKVYEIGTITSNPENITVSGPQSLIQKISSVVVDVDVTNMSHSGTISGTLKIIDKNQDIMSDAETKFLSFDTGSSSIDVSVELWKKKSEVSLNVEYSGIPSEGYQVSGITTTPETITVCGTDEALARLEEDGNKLTIPAEMVVVNGLSQDAEFTVNLDELLAEQDDLRISSGSSSQVTVHVAVMSDLTKEYLMDVDKIEIKNLAKNLSVSFDNTQFEIRVSSDQGNTLTSDQIKVSLDCSDYNVGDYTAELDVTLPEGYELADTPTLTIHLKESAETSQNNGTAAASTVQNSQTQ